MKVYRKVVGAIQENCYLLEGDEQQAIIVDPGAEEKHLIEWMFELELKPQAILITHAHFDHIGAADFLRDYYGIKTYGPMEEIEMMADARQNLSAYFFGQPITAVCDTGLKDGDSLELMAGLPVEVISVPGHSPASLCYYFKKQKLVFGGDTLFRNSIGRTDFFEGEPTTLVTNIKRRLFCLPDNTTVYPGHGERTTIGREKIDNVFLR